MLRREKGYYGTSTSPAQLSRYHAPWYLSALADYTMVPW